MPMHDCGSFSSPSPPRLIPDPDPVCHPTQLRDNFLLSLPGSKSFPTPLGNGQYIVLSPMPRLLPQPIMGHQDVLLLTWTDSSRSLQRLLIPCAPVFPTPPASASHGSVTSPSAVGLSALSRSLFAFTLVRPRPSPLELTGRLCPCPGRSGV